MPSKDHENGVDESVNTKEENGTKKNEKDAEMENSGAQEESEPNKKEEGQEQEGSEGDAHAGQKRKHEERPTGEEDQNGSKKAARTKGTKSGGATLKQLLNFLLSADALPYCFPDEELEAAKKKQGLKCYSLTSPTSLTAFEHLVCAHLLSKPLSHALGLRSIRTLLNEPYNFGTAKRIVDAGEDKVWQALEDAKTQHRQKTARYLSGMAREYAPDKAGDTMFDLAEKANNEGPNGVVEHIKETVPGLGKIGGEIFCRRIQCVYGWGDALWPYADGKALECLREIGIDVEDADELQNGIESLVDWERVGDMGLQERVLSKGELAGEEMETQVQAEFVVALERAVGCVLEGKVEEFRKAAAEA